MKNETTKRIGDVLPQQERFFADVEKNIKMVDIVNQEVTILDISDELNGADGSTFIIAKCENGEGLFTCAIGATVVKEKLQAVKSTNDFPVVATIFKVVGKKYYDVK